MGISQRKYGPLTGVPGTQPTGYSTDQLTRQLNMFGEIMQTVAKMLPNNLQSLPEKSLQTRQKLITEFQRSHKLNRIKLAGRREKIELYKKEHEQAHEKRREYEKRLEAERREQKQREQEQEELHLQEEARERERRRVEEEAAHLRRKINRQHISTLITKEAENGTPALPGGSIHGVSLVSSTGTTGTKRGASVAAGLLGATVSELKNITDDKLDTFNANEVLEKTAQEMKKKNRELKEKAKQRSQQLDYLTRAMRIVEMPLLQEQAIVDSQLAIQLAEQREEERKEKQSQLAENRKRLERLEPNIKELRSKLELMALERLKGEKEIWERRCNQEYEVRLEQRKKNLEEDMKKEEERRRQAEQERAKREQEEAAAAAAVASREIDNGYVMVDAKAVGDQQNIYRPPTRSDGPQLYRPPTSRTPLYKPKTDEPGSMRILGKGENPDKQDAWVRGSANRNSGMIRDTRANNNTFSFGNQPEVQPQDKVPAWRKMNKKR
ncbi:Eukaryotic translation initiation factor 3 subunit A [Cichlidogyrus casuarinus]|uniref:Eukaryotic translation initiation factor 3 subunit A n=1 Tax=Cichlidogyrus casuarinus TaxID=1844966 RepID=A0ABD2Q231_9PLAT